MVTCGVSSDRGDNCSNTVAVLQELGVSRPDPEDVAVVREVAEMVCRRAAYVVSAGKPARDGGEGRRVGGGGGGGGGTLSVKWTLA